MKQGLSSGDNINDLSKILISLPRQNTEQELGGGGAYRSTALISLIIMYTQRIHTVNETTVHREKC